MGITTEKGSASGTASLYPSFFPAATGLSGVYQKVASAGRGCVPVEGSLFLCAGEHIGDQLIQAGNLDPLAFAESRPVYTVSDENFVIGRNTDQDHSMIAVGPELCRLICLAVFL